MRKAMIALAVSSLAITACATAESAAVKDDEQHVEVHVMKHVVKDGEGEHIKIHIEREGEDPIHIEGDPNSPEVKAALAEVGGDMHFVHDGDHAMKHKMHVMKSKGEGDDQHVWVMKTEGEEGGDVTVDIEVSDDGKKEVVIIKKDGKVTRIPMDGKDGKRVFITKDGDKTMVKEHTEKKVIVITGENEEEIKKKLEELDLEFDIDIEFGEDGEVEVIIEE